MVKVSGSRRTRVSHSPKTFKKNDIFSAPVNVPPSLSPPENDERIVAGVSRRTQQFKSNKEKSDVVCIGEVDQPKLDFVGKLLSRTFQKKFFRYYRQSYERPCTEGTMVAL